VRYKDKVRRARVYADRVKKKQEIYEIKHQFDQRKKKLEFGKIMLLFVLINIGIVEAYSMWVMYALGDLSALPTLITCIIGDCISLSTYMIKSTFENRAGGITFEAMMNSFKIRREDEMSQEDIDEAVG